jgi:DNA-binding transcriptional ArsR family regulator
MIDAEPAIAETAALFGDPVRAAMLVALLDKSPQSAGQLAFAANVSPQTASFHLAKLTAAALLTGERQGRHQVYRLARCEVASAIESLAAIVRYGTAPRRFGSERMRQLRRARTCYDHLAGIAGVLLHDSILRSNYLAPAVDKAYILTANGRDWLQSIGIDPQRERTRAPFARPCLDWSERRPHLAGRMAAHLLDHLFKDGWIVRIRDTRAVRITDRGLRQFERQFGVRL